MSRDPSGVYTLPAASDGVANQTIISAKYNGVIHDIESDLNIPRPVVAGGTGATTPSAARTNLGAEVTLASQIVTNYNSQVWECGAFASNTGATNSPDGAGAATNYYWGTALLAAADQTNVVLEARNLTTGVNYMRKKVGGVWGAWTPDSGSGAFVQKTGDTMTGSLVLNYTSPIFTLNAPLAGQIMRLESRINNAMRWSVDLGEGSPDTGGNSGTHFQISRWTDAGASNSALTINRTTGVMTVNTYVSVLSKGSVFGGPSGTTMPAAPVNTDANLFMYNASSVNWCGMGTDPNGVFWLRTGTSGTPLPAITISADQQTTFRGQGINFGPAATSAAAHFVYSSSGGFAGSTFRANADPGFACSFYSAGAGLSGSIVVNATTVAYNTSSDGRLKEDLKSFDAGRIIDDTMVYDFAWKSTGERAYGVIGQQANEVYPTAVSYKKDEDWWGVDYSKYVPVLLQELKALRARVAELEVNAGVRPAAG